MKIFKKMMMKLKMYHILNNFLNQKLIIMMKINLIKLKKDSMRLL